MFKQNNDYNRKIFYYITLCFSLAAIAIIIFISCLTKAYALSTYDLEEYRYTTKVLRNADGTINRQPIVIKAFRKIHPCPSTGLTTGACSGWAINHVIPLACGGRDAVSNMQWLPNNIKSCKDIYCIDRFERKINALIPPIPDTANCKNEIIH